MDKALALECAGQVLDGAIDDPADCTVDDLNMRACEIDAVQRFALDEDVVFVMFTHKQWRALDIELQAIEAELSTRQFGGVA